MLECDHCSGHVRAKDAGKLGWTAVEAESASCVGGNVAIPLFPRDFLVHHHALKSAPLWPLAVQCHRARRRAGGEGAQFGCLRPAGFCQIEDESENINPKIS